MVTIRRARLGDAAAIARVEIETWRETYAGVLPDKALLGMSERRKTATWRAAIAGSKSGARVLVAECSGEGVVGFGSCGPARPSSLRHDGEVFTLYLLPDFQGRGVGRALLGALFASLAGAGMHSALIWVLDVNPSRFFYQAMGGAPVARRNEHLWGTAVRAMAYGWDDLAALPRTAAGTVVRRSRRP